MLFRNLTRILAFAAVFVFFPGSQLWKLPAGSAGIDFVAYGQISDGVIRTLAGTGSTDFCCDGGAATEANIAPDAVAIDSAGNLYIADLANHRIRKVYFSGGSGIVNTLASENLQAPSDVKVDASGSLYIADPASNRVLKVTAKGGISNFAGTGEAGFSGDSGLAIFAQLNSPSSIATDTAGNVYILDAGNLRIRKVTSNTQIIETIAGTGESGFSGDGGPATSAQINIKYPAFSTGMTVDSFGYLYFSDSGNGRIRRISPRGVIKTVAGGGTLADDGIAALSSLIQEPRGIALDPAGTIYFADNGSHLVRKVNAAGIISTVAGTGSPGFSGDDGPALSAQLSSPSGIALDEAHNLYIADEGNARVRKVAVGADSSVIQARLSARHVFPQFTDGQLDDGSYYRTTVLIANPSASDSASCDLLLHGVALSGLSSSYQIPPGSWIAATSSGTQPFQSGYATLSCSSRVDGSLIYSLYGATNIKVGEVTVFPSPPASSGQIFLDNREGARLGIAIANDTDQSANYSVTVVDDFGRSLATATSSIAPRTSRAAFLDEIIALPPNQVGQVSLTADQNLSVTGLRFTGHSFTTIPAMIHSSMSATANKYHVFPQFADGVLADGSRYRSTLMIATGPDGADCSYQRRGSRGTVSNVKYSFSSGSWFINGSLGTQPFESGYATLACSDSVDAVLLYAFYSPAGVKLSEVTVFSSPPADVAQILGDGREGARLALAIANDTDRTASYLIRAGDSNGSPVGLRTLSLGPRSARAFFLDELFRVVPNNVGPILINSDAGPSNVIGIRFTGDVFTMVPGTSEPPLLGLVKAGTSH